jgi:hypothetical protein
MRDGGIRNQAILDFQHRAERYPHEVLG